MGYAKRSRKKRQMVNESSRCLICIRNPMDGGSRGFSNKCTLVDVFKCLSSVIIEFL